MSVLMILAAILMLGVMVMVHECGHFFAARLTGIPVKEFAIGFGPKLFSWKSKKHETRFFWRLIPAGGYCMFYGEDDAEGKEREDPRSINRYAVWKRLLTILMGPMMNFVLALLAATALFFVLGEDVNGVVGRAVISQVNDGGAAQAAGMQAGDIILSVNGQAASGVTEEGLLSASAMIGAYKEGDAPLQIAVLRGEDTLSLSMTPKYDAAEKRFMIGVGLSYEYTPGYARVSLGRAAALGGDYCLRAAGAILDGLKTMVTTGQGFAESSGPVGIVHMIAEETEKSGWTAYVQLLVLISVNLGLFNLIPIPGLDGARAIFLIIEGVRRKPVNRKTEAYVHLAGYVLLFGLLLVMTCKDILQLFQ